MTDSPEATSADEPDLTQVDGDPSSSKTDPAGETLIEPDDHSVHLPASLAADSRPLAGTFGRYQIVKLLGEGGMGAVYLAEDSQLNRQVALKVPRFSEQSPDNLIDRFYREARSAGTLTHPNICPVYDVGEIEGRHFISMGFIDGRPLSDYIESGKKQPEKQVAGVVRKLALALQEAHDKGIIHRDLKPPNVMIDRRNEPIVMDFGLAGHTEDRGEAKLTKDGAVMGSPAYMSPEQVGGAGDLGPATDIYSLGVVLYELLTGQTPFQGRVISVIGQIVNSEPKSPQELRTDLSPEITAICLKAMAKSPSDRFASMTEFAQALRAFVEGDSVPGVTGSQTTVSANELQKRRAEATSFLKSGQLRKAVTTLESVTGDPTLSKTDLGSWAEERLPQAKAKLEKAVEESKSLLRRARKSMDSHDYDRAWQLLDQIPEDLANNAVTDLRAEAQELSEEVQELSDDIEDAVQTGRFDGVMPSIERMLELKPNHRQANDLYEQVRATPARQKGPKRGKKSKGRRSQSVPLLPSLIAVGVAVILLSIAYGAGWFDTDDNAQQQIVSGVPPRNSGDQPRPDGQIQTSPDGLRDFGSGAPTGERFDQAGEDRQRDNDLKPGKPPFRFLGKGDSPDAAFKRVDKNSDNEVDLEEVPAYIIERADSDGDKKVTYDEFLSAFGRLGADFFRPPKAGRGPQKGQLREGRDRPAGFRGRPPNRGPVSPEE